MGMECGRRCGSRQGLGLSNTVKPVVGKSYRKTLRRSEIVNRHLLGWLYRQSLTLLRRGGNLVGIAL